MIYITLNKGNTLDLLIRMIEQSGDYEEYVKEDLKGCNEEPFFNDKWLLRLPYDRLKKESDDLRKIINSDLVDIIIECNNSDSYKDAQKIIFGICENEGVKNKSGIVKLYSSYKLQESHIRKYIKWVLLFKEDKNILDILDRLGDREDIEVEKVVDLLCSKFKGNEDRIRDFMILEGDGIFENTKSKIDSLLPKRKFVNAYNMWQYIFSRDSSKSRDIVNTIYSCSDKMFFVRKQYNEFVKEYESLYKEYIHGDFNIKNKEKWLMVKGSNFKIKSEYSFNIWYKVVSENSYEKILYYKLILDDCKTNSDIYNTVLKIIKGYGIGGKK